MQDESSLCKTKRFQSIQIRIFLISSIKNPEKYLDSGIERVADKRRVGEGGGLEKQLNANMRGGGWKVELNVGREESKM